MTLTFEILEIANTGMFGKITAIVFTLSLIFVGGCLIWYGVSGIKKCLRRDI